MHNPPLVAELLPASLYVRYVLLPNNRLNSTAFFQDGTARQLFYMFARHDHILQKLAFSPRDRAAKQYMAALSAINVEKGYPVVLPQGEYAHAIFQWVQVEHALACHHILNHNHTARTTIDPQAILNICAKTGVTEWIPPAFSALLYAINLYQYSCWHAVEDPLKMHTAITRGSATTLLVSSSLIGTSFFLIPLLSALLLTLSGYALNNLHKQLTAKTTAHCSEAYGKYLTTLRPPYTQDWHDSIAKCHSSAYVGDAQRLLVGQLSQLLLLNNPELNSVEIHKLSPHMTIHLLQYLYHKTPHPSSADITRKLLPLLNASAPRQETDNS